MTFRAPVLTPLVLPALLNALAGGFAMATLNDHPAALGTALLAYCLGLRHAVDADHIAAIDNVTRKLAQDGRRPLLVGLSFAIGHSVIVFAVTIAAMNVVILGPSGAGSRLRNGATPLFCKTTTAY